MASTWVPAWMRTRATTGMRPLWGTGVTVLSCGGRLGSRHVHPVSDLRALAWCWREIQRWERSGGRFDRKRMGCSPCFHGAAAHFVVCRAAALREFCAARRRQATR